MDVASTSLPLEPETVQLRRCINDLVGVLGLRNLWLSAGQSDVVEMLADVLAQMLRPDFVFVRAFGDTPGCDDVVCCRVGEHRAPTFRGIVTRTASDWYDRETRLGSHETIYSLDGLDYPAVGLDLGMRGQFGFLVVGCRRAGFPTSAERLLLNVAASQALIALQQNRILQEQKDVAAQLDTLVAQRTLALAQTTQALRRSDALMAQAEMASQTGSFRWDPHSEILEWSAQARLLFGFEPNRTVTTADFYAHVDPADHERLLAAGEPASSTPTQIDLKFTILPVNREPRVVHLRAQPEHSALDRFIYIGTMQDITDRVRAEIASQESEVRLHEMREELCHAARLATLGQFSAAISHDVRQPLSSVSASARAAVNWLNAPEPDIDAALQATERIVKGVKRAADILDRVKSFSRRTTPGALVDLNELVQDTVSLAEADADHRRVEVRTELSPDLPELWLDRLQLQQVVMNLLVNAIDALDDATLQTRVVTVTTWHRDGEVGVEVRDTGRGVNERAMPKLFETFNTTKESGLGMGLSICRDIVTEHHGRIWVENLVPQGAMFSFALPIELSDSDHSTALAKL